jgi:hypothetical protein
MISLKDYLEAVNYRVTGGTEYQWDCFGQSARYMDCDSPVLNQFSVNAIFDSEDQTVYSVEAWDYSNDRCYRWIHPDYIKAFKKACKKHDVEFKTACDTMDFIDLEEPADILEKANAIVLQESYDPRVQISVDMSDEDMLQYMKLAHSMDITFNELVERALQNAVDEVKAGRLTKETAQEWLEEQNED